MTVHLKRDLDDIKRQILQIGAMVEDAANKAIAAILERRRDLAKEVVRGDGEIDRREVELEETCLKVLALHQPVAADLRYIVVALKVNNDLERMGDLAANIAERAVHLAALPPLPVPPEFRTMAQKARVMVRDSLDALVQSDPARARRILRDDDEVDDLHRLLYRELQSIMTRDPRTVERAIHFLSATRHLERIADLTTNIAEDVIYMVDGEVVRHRPVPMEGEE